ncbi:hypothetical protein QZH41_011780, partial [Actinostola sp. cb2023]
LAGYHTAKSDPPLPVPNDDNRNVVKTGWVDDGLDLGDYPNLPYISSQRRQYFGWWDMQDRRNYAEPVHEDEDAINIWVWQEVESNDKYTRDHTVPLMRQVILIFDRTEVLKHFLVAFGFLGVVGYLSYLYDAPSQNPAIPREFPYDNLYLERGGDPGKDPAEDKGKVPNSLFGM